MKLFRLASPALVAAILVTILGCASAQTVDTASQPDDSGSAIPVVQTDSPWEASVESLGKEIGDRFALVLPAGGSVSSLWGTRTYTSDSSIGSAAVQAGLITFASGGRVEVEVTGGEPYYLGSEANGVISESYAEWDVSFILLKDGRPLFTEPYSTIDWSVTADLFPEGRTITVTLPPGGEPEGIWGTGTYTSDSAIGTAAVHSGLITFEQGGTVTFMRVTGLDEYRGSVANGVSSEGYGPWESAFTFVK